MEDHPLIILIVLFVLIGLTYGSHKTINTTPASGTGVNLTSSPNKTTAENVKTVAQDVQNLQTNVNEKVAEKNRSPYYQKIYISGPSGLYQNDPEREYFTITTGLEKNETVKITGWYLKSEVTGYSVAIGKASLLPFPFNINAQSDIILQKGDRAYLTKGFSPIGVSFRTNKCVGYLQENRFFTPGLYSNCPLPKDEKLPTFSNNLDSNDQCVSTIERIPQCTTVSSTFIKNLPDTINDSCKTYMTTQINYNTCVALHFSDIDFPGNEYRLYLNKFGPLWRTAHDTIDLRDENGLVVYTIKY